MRYALTIVVLTILLGGAVTSCVTTQTPPTGILKEASNPAFHVCLNAYLKSIDSDSVPEDGYDLSFVDLNKDGIMEAIALMNGKTGWVGSGGATMFVFKGSEDAYQFISRNTITRKPIYVRHKKNNGWCDLVVYNSGGGAKPSNRLMVFDGNGYPLNPSVQPEATIINSDVMVMSDVEQKNPPDKK